MSVQTEQKAIEHFHVEFGLTHDERMTLRGEHIRLLDAPVYISQLSHLVTDVVQNVHSSRSRGTRIESDPNDPSTINIFTRGMWISESCDFSLVRFNKEDLQVAKSEKFPPRYIQAWDQIGFSPEKFKGDSLDHHYTVEHTIDDLQQYLLYRLLEGPARGVTEEKRFPYPDGLLPNILTKMIDACRKFPESMSGMHEEIGRVDEVDRIVDVLSTFGIKRTAQGRLLGPIKPDIQLNQGYSLYRNPPYVELMFR